MKKLTAAQIIFLIITILIISYFLTGIVCFILNDAIKMIPKYYDYTFTAKALLNGYSQIYKALGITLFFCSLIAFLIPFIPKKESLFGNARFANISDIRKMKLFEKKPKKKGEININETGLIIGKVGNKLLRFYGQQFVSLGAPTRSGKGVGIVIPNLMEWGGSAVVQDIKQECFDFTSKFRHDVLNQEIFLFNPFDKRTHRYNPMHYIDMNSGNADSDLEDLAGIIFPPGKDPFFDLQAQNLFIGLCWLCHDLLNSENGLAFLAYHKIDLSFNLYNILMLRQGFNIEIKGEEGDTHKIEGFANTYALLVELKLLGQKCQNRIKKYIGITSDNTRSSIDGSFDAPLMMYESDNVRLATSGNDFDFRDLRKKKMTIYVGILPDKLSKASRILNIFWQHLILLNTKELPETNKELKYPVLLLMDEFTAPGNLPVYLKAVSFMAGFNLRSFMIYQSNSQLETPAPEGYGTQGAKTLLANHACQIYYAMKDDDADRLSKSLRNKTVKNISRGNSSSKGGGSSSRNISETSRPLMLPQEIEEMDFEDEIIRIEGKLPIKCKKALYFNDSYFMDRFKMVSKSLKTIKGIPDRSAFNIAVQSGETRVEIPIQSFDILEKETKQKMKEYIEKYTNKDQDISKEKDSHIDDNEANIEDMIQRMEELADDENSENNVELLENKTNIGEKNE